MTIWEAMQTPLREGMITGIMFLVLFQGYLCLINVRNGNQGRLAIVTCLQFLYLFTVLFLLLDGAFHYGETEYPRTWPLLTTFFCSLPVMALLFFELLSLGWLIWEFRMLRHYRESHLTPWSVKEALDLLPAGVVFAEENGNIVFTNLTMKRILSIMTGKILTNVQPLTEQWGKENKVFQVALPDDSQVWQFARNGIVEDGKKYIQLTATDVTASVRIHEELQGKNQKLREIKRRLEIYNRKAEQIIISQELLNARMQVHNETGHVLLASRHYMDHPNAVDEAALLETLKLTNAHLLKEYEEDDTDRDQLSEALEMAREIGVTVRLSGFIPEDGARRTVLAAAINECATNTRKHADGDLLEVEIEDSGKQCMISLVCNGEVPMKPISESGGLASLRTLVENAGGSMEISSSSVFKIIIFIP